MTKTSLSVLDIEDGWAGVDAWESPGILSAAEAHDADKHMSAVKLKLDSAEKSYARCAASARDHMEEMAALLTKVKLSTATKEEMERLSKLDAEMERLKAEIMESKSDIKTFSEDMVKSVSKTKTYALMKTAKEHDIKSVIRFVREAERVDLAFLLDCTGSMASYIEAAKSSIKDIVRRVGRTNAGLKLRVAVVGYRDLGDTNRFEVLDFTSAVEDFERFVSLLKAGGGGDAPEDIAGAIQKANALSWQQTSRLTFLIADAPCHGRKFNGLTGGDSYPEGTPGICIEAELKKLMEKGGQAGMQLHFVRYHDSQIQREGHRVRSLRPERSQQTYIDSYFECPQIYFEECHGVEVKK
jgi:rRNA maturation endonuclease Nob1